MKAGMTKETDKEFVERHWDNPTAINQRLQSLKHSKKLAALKSLRNAASEHDRDYCVICKQVRSWCDVEHPEPWDYQPREAGDLSRHEYCEYCKSERKFDYEGNYEGLVKRKYLKNTVKGREKVREYYQSEQYIKKSYFFREIINIFKLQSEIDQKKDELLCMSNEFWEDFENSLDELKPREVKDVIKRFQFLKPSDVELNELSIPPKLLSIIEGKD